MKPCLMLIVPLLMLTPARARLGETIEQCRTRYGESARSSFDNTLNGTAVYSKNDLTITIHFASGKADLIRYSPGQVSTVDFDLAKYLLQLNGREKEWDQLTKTQVVMQDLQDLSAQYPRIELVDPILWKSKDGILQASYSVSKGTFEARAAAFQDKIREGL